MSILFGFNFLAALSFMFTGATLSWSSPAIPKFKNGNADIRITDTQCSWVVSLLSIGAITGCFLGQILSENVGRKKTIFCAAVPGFIGAAIILWTKLPELMYLARFVIGISTGTTAVVTMIYVTEISDKEIRGSLGMVVQVMNNFGSLLIYSVGPFVSYNTLNCIVLAIPICYVVACLWIPESPYYHLKDNRLEAARREFMRLKGAKDIRVIEEELTNIRLHVRESMENKTTYKELFFNVRYRRAIYIVTGLKLLQYMTGILAIQAYLEPIFRQSSSISGPKASIIYGFVQLIAGIIATFLARWLGRRLLMITSCAGVGICLTSVGAFFFLKDFLNASPTTLDSINALPLFGILGFIIFYSIGAGNIPYIMQAELFPINVKAIASSSATIFACVLSFLVTKCYLSFKEVFGHYTVFWSFACISYSGIIFVYYCMPETGNRTLEDVQDCVLEQSPEEEALKSKPDGYCETLKTKNNK